MKYYNKITSIVLVFFFLFLLIPANVIATTYYVATNGIDSSTVSGLSPTSAWKTPSYAISRVSANNTIIVLDGVYSNNIVFNGSAKSGIVLKSQNKWKARITGTAAYNDHNVRFAYGVSNVVLDGFEIAYSYRDNVKVEEYCNFNTIQNCWIHHAGRGNPNWVTNTGANFSGQGLYMTGFTYGNLFQNNLSENNGAWIGHDHGIYLSGTNHIVRNNVFRYNLAYGIQLYNDSVNNCCKDIKVYNNLVYNNGWWMNKPFDGRCLAVYTSGYATLPFTNYIYNNTFICDKAPSGANGYLVDMVGTVFFINNILLSPNGFDVYNSRPATAWLDYNLFTNKPNFLTNTSAQQYVVDGGHNRYNVSSAGFLNPANGLYWLNSTSYARNMALGYYCGSIDFFSNPQTNVFDVGFSQYNTTYAGDTRNLSITNGANYWAILQSGWYPPVVQNRGVTLGITVSGTEPMYYQWYFNNYPVSGAVNNTFVIPSASSLNSGTYYLITTNAVGKATSSPITLTIQ